MGTTMEAGRQEPAVSEVSTNLLIDLNIYELSPEQQKVWLRFAPTRIGETKVMCKNFLKEFRETTRSSSMAT